MNRSNPHGKPPRDDDAVRDLGDGDLPAPDAEGMTPDEPAPEASAAPAENAKDMRDRWLRAEAELQNYRRRAARELDEARRAADEPWLLKLIEVLDDLERAIDSARKDGADPAWLKGVDLAAQRMRDQLGRSGVTPIAAQGEPFDPHVHEALMEVDAEGTPGTVAQVIRPGWKRGDRVLRAARVAIVREPAERR
jgi:molecular chaperone GrpE